MQKMIISGYDAAGEDGTGTGSPIDFEVMINPATLAVGKRIIRNKDKNPQGHQATSTFEAMAADTLTFELVLDGTGVVNEKQTEPLQKTVQTLQDVVYHYQTESHQPRFNVIKWGEFLFRGYLTNMDLKYTLFDEEGYALRARVNLSFEGYIPPQKFERNPGSASPDLTHVRFVNSTDTLMNFCQEIYGDTRYVNQVARYNGLLSFRSLVPGTRLEFPPLIHKYD